MNTNHDKNLNNNRIINFTTNNKNKQINKINPPPYRYNIINEPLCISYCCRLYIKLTT